MAARRAPVVWLLGKVQSGKSSIVRAFTGAAAAEVGEGYRAVTRTARAFDFPADAPMLRFLDTRGLGEVAYDPAEDLALFQKTAHLLLVVMRAMDPDQAQIIAVARRVRETNGDCPMVVAQTALHDGYEAGADHVMPYPWAAPLEELAGKLPVSGDLLRAMAHQRRAFKDLPGARPQFVPIDFTQPGDGLEPRDYGIEALAAALIECAPAALAAAVAVLPGLAEETRRRAARPIVIGHATAAAGCDLIPVAGAVGVPAIQARMMQQLVSIYGEPWTSRLLVELTAALGAGVGTRAAAGFGLRQLAKLIPGYGQTIAAAGAAASSFAFTYAVGMAGIVFLERRRAGRSDHRAVAEAYKKALGEAFGIYRAQGGGAPP